MQKQLESHERDELLHALHELHNRCTIAKLKVETYGAVYDQLEDLLRQVDSTTALLEDYRPALPHRVGMNS